MKFKLIFEPSNDSNSLIKQYYQLDGMAYYQTILTILNKKENEVPISRVINKRIKKLTSFEITLEEIEKIKLINGFKTESVLYVFVSPDLFMHFAKLVVKEEIFVTYNHGDTIYYFLDVKINKDALLKYWLAVNQPTVLE